MKWGANERWVRANAVKDCPSKDYGDYCWMCTGDVNADAFTSMYYEVDELWHPDIASLMLDGLACEDLP